MARRTSARAAAPLPVTVTRLARDRTGRGELKLITKAIKELRYAFKIFSAYHHVRKVSIFGSSRTPVGHPDYIQADAFARRMREEKWMVITGAGDGIMRAGHDGAGREASFGVAIRLRDHRAIVLYIDAELRGEEERRDNLRADAGELSEQLAALRVDSHRFLLSEILNRFYHPPTGFEKPAADLLSPDKCDIPRSPREDNI